MMWGRKNDLEALNTRLAQLESKQPSDIGDFQTSLLDFEKRLELLEQRHAQLHNLLIQTSMTTGREGLTKTGRQLAQSYGGVLFGMNSSAPPGK